MADRIQHFFSVTLLAGGLACVALTATAADRNPGQLNMKGELDGDALGFGIQGETFKPLPGIDADALAAPSGGPDVKLDDEEASPAAAGQ